MRLTNRLLEKNWKVVDDSVTPTNLLHKLTTYTQHHAAEMLRLATSKHSFERCSFSPSVTRGLDTIHDDLLLQLSFLVLDLKAAKSCNDFLAFFIALSSQEPAR